MPKLKVPLLSFESTGRLGKLFSFARRGGRNIIERRPTPPDAKSPSQLFNRHMFNKCTNLWHTLDRTEQLEWEHLARRRHMTGYAWFISQCLRPNPGIYLPLQGGTMQGDINMATFRLLDLIDPALEQEPVTKKYYEDHLPASYTHPGTIQCVLTEPNIPAAIARDTEVAAAITAALYTQGARAYHSADQSIPNQTWTVLALNSERLDTDTIHDLVTNNSRLTCKTAGKYVISASICFSFNTTGVRLLDIYLNGATSLARNGVPAPTSASGGEFNATTIYNLAVDDYIEMRAYQNSTVAVNVQATPNWSPELMMQRIG